MEQILAIRMEFLQTLWLYVAALYPMRRIYLSDSGYIGKSYRVNISDCS
jgi:hypothetical protein